MSKAKKKSGSVGSLRLKGWRKFKDEIKVDLGRVNFLLGPNNAGKTSFLSLFQFISKMTDANWPRSVPGEVVSAVAPNLDEVLYRGTTSCSVEFVLDQSLAKRNVLLDIRDYTSSFELKRREDSLSIKNLYLGSEEFRYHFLTEHGTWFYDQSTQVTTVLLMDTSSGRLRTVDEIYELLSDLGGQVLSRLSSIPGFRIEAGAHALLTGLMSDPKLEVDWLFDFFLGIGRHDYQSLGTLTVKSGVWRVVLSSRLTLEVVHEVSDPDEWEQGDGEPAWDLLSYADRKRSYLELRGHLFWMNFKAWPDEIKGGEDDCWSAFLSASLPANQGRFKEELVTLFSEWRNVVEHSFTIREHFHEFVDAVKGNNALSEFLESSHQLLDFARSGFLPSPLSVTNSSEVPESDFAAHALGWNSEIGETLDEQRLWQTMQDLARHDVFGGVRFKVHWVSPTTDKVLSWIPKESMEFNHLLDRKERSSFNWFMEKKVEWEFELSRCLIYLGIAGGFKIMRRAKGAAHQLELSELAVDTIALYSSIHEIRKGHNAQFKEGGKGVLAPVKMGPSELGRAANSVIRLMMSLMDLKIGQRYESSPLFVVLEEPSAFMHPRIASRFTDVVRHLAEILDLVVFVETHSEYMVRQLSTSRLKGDDLDDVRIHYFGAPGKEAVMPIRVDRDGVFNPAIPEGFLDKSSSMLREQRELKRNRKTK